MYNVADRNVWNGRIDHIDGEQGYRWHQIIQFLDLNGPIIPPSQNTSIALVGFECDEGVRRNQGRLGAALAPNAIRKCLANFAVHFDTKTNSIFDVGNVSVGDSQLEAGQEKLAEIVRLLQQKGYFTIVIGGGHETAFGHYMGLMHSGKYENIGIINIDAHFDLRSYNVGNSGTPFLQIAKKLASNNLSMWYKVLGIEKAANTVALFEKATQIGTQWLTNQELFKMSQSEIQGSMLEFTDKVDAIYLSLDMDAIAADAAPGVSAAAPFGLSPMLVNSLIEYIYATQKVISFDVVETNPVFDIDSRTAKLAARYIYGVVESVANFPN